MDTKENPGHEHAEPAASEIVPREARPVGAPSGFRWPCEEAHLAKVAGKAGAPSGRDSIAHPALRVQRLRGRRTQHEGNSADDCVAEGHSR